MTNTLDTKTRPQQGLSTRTAWSLLILVFFAVQIGSLFTPPLLDDVDASHAQAAQHMAETGDWVTLKVNGIRYIEKPPLPYWLTAAYYRIFGQNVFATHLPNALAMLGCAWLAGCGRAAPGARRAGLLCRPGRAHLDWAVSVYALHHSRGAAHASFCCLRSMGLLTGLESTGRAAHLRHVGGAGAGHC